MTTRDLIFLICGVAVGISIGTIWEYWTGYYRWEKSLKRDKLD